LRFVDGQAVAVDQANLRGPVGQISGNGSLSFEGPLAFQFKGQELSLAELVGAERARTLGASGKLMVAGRIQGDSTTPLVSAYVTSPGLRFANRELGETHLEAKIQGKQLQIWGRPFGDARASGEVELKAPFAYTASVSLSLSEIRSLLPRGAIAQGLSGTVAGTVKAEGKAAQLEDSEVSASFTTLRLSRSDFTVENSAPVRLGYSDRRLKLTSFALHGPNTELSLAGWIDRSRLDLKMSGAMDMRLLESFVPNLERTTGRIELSASATGSTQEPTLLGRAEVRDTGLTLRDPAVVVKNLSGVVEFSQARVLFQDFHGVVNDGRLSLRGTAQLEKFDLKHLELAAQVEELALRPVEELPIQLSGQLSLLGKPGAFTLAGDLDILKLRYERPVTLEKLLPEIQKGRGPTSYEPPTEWLTFDVGLHAKGDVRVENNIARAKLVGDLRLTGTNVHPGLLGTIRSAEGSQAFFRGNQFAILQGLLEFKERKSIDTVFDVHAEARVREYLVRLHAFGRTSDPKAVLTSEPPLPEGDVLSLLTLGVISTDKTNTAGAGAGLAAEALFSASGLDRQVQRFLPRNPLLRDLSFHIATVYNDYTGLLEPSAQLESKFLTEQLKLRLTQPVSGHGTRAQAEYWFDERLSAQAQWDNEHTEYSNIPSLGSLGNFGLNLKLHWESD
jgi:translocation and assembly module TamB